MKRYEMMSKQEIVDGIRKTQGYCSLCPVQNNCGNGKTDEKECINTYVVWLNEEVQTKPRIAMINTVRELELAHDEFMKSEDPSFIDYLIKEVEVDDRY